jgi:hypothetical protein
MESRTTWYVSTTRCRNGIEYKTKFPVRHSEQAIRNRERRQRETNRAAKLARESAITLGQELNDNYQVGVDQHLVLSLSDEALEKIIRLAGSEERDAVLLKLDNYVARQVVNKLLLPLCRAAGIAPVYHWVSSDMDGKTGAQERPHVHMVCTRAVADLMRQAWERRHMGEIVKARTLYSHHHGDLQELAEYLIGQTRPFAGKNRYHPSRSATRPEHGKPRLSPNGSADLTLPRGCVKIYRSEFQAGRPQMLRYWRPPAEGEAGP